MKSESYEFGPRDGMRALLDTPIRYGDALRLTTFAGAPMTGGQRTVPVNWYPMASLGVAAAEAGLGTEIGKAAVSTLVGWLLGKGLEAGTDGSGGEGGFHWREDGFDEIVLDSGPGGGYVIDGSAPRFGSVTHAWPGCCDEDAPDDGIKLSVSVEVNDRTHEYMETETGVKSLELNVHRINDRESNDVDTQQVDSEEFGLRKKGMKDDEYDEVELEGCVPCSYLQSVDEITVTIKAVDWEGNTRIKKQTYTVPRELREKCC